MGRAPLCTVGRGRGGLRLGVGVDEGGGGGGGLRGKGVGGWRGRGRGRATRVRSAETREREGVCEVEGRWGGRFGDACVCGVCARLTVMGVNRARARRRNS